MPTYRLFAFVTLVGTALAAVAMSLDWASASSGVRRLSASSLAIILALLLMNALMAAVRLKIIAGDISSSINFRQAMAAVSSGSLGGAVFFQIAGQLMARGFFMGREGVPLASVIVMTVYERISAAAIAAILAVFGAYFIFGQVVLDRQAGGAELIKLLLGLTTALLAAAAAGFGKHTIRTAAPLMNRTVGLRLLRSAGLSFLVQAPMLAAYIVIMHALSPTTSVADIAAASMLISFAASIPISFAGWGVREMSAVAALGAIGVAPGVAVIGAIIIGVGSLLAMTILAALSLRTRAQLGKGTFDKGIIDEKLVTPIDYAGFLYWIIPIAAAVFVFFQIYVPISSGTLLAVNLADPLAILGGSLLVYQSVRRGQLPPWRVPWTNTVIGLATLLLAAALITGAIRFGWTEWAWVNRFLGWFVLLGYASTGALVVQHSGRLGFGIVLRSFAGAAAGIAALEVVLSLLRTSGIDMMLPLNPTALTGFSQNRNFFAFQLLIALVATMVAVRRDTIRKVLMTLIIAGIWFSGSRSGWIATGFVFAAGLYIGALRTREAALVLGCVSAIAIVSAGLGTVGGSGFGQTGLPNVLPESASTDERLLSMRRGWQMFLEHPVFGAGLGAFRTESLLLSPAVLPPLLIHSTALWLLAETGIVGLLVFAIPALLLLLAEGRHKAPLPASKLVLLCLTVFAVMSAPADMMYQRTFWLLIGIGLAVPFSRSERAG